MRFPRTTYARMHTNTKVELIFFFFFYYADWTRKGSEAMFAFVCLCHRRVGEGRKAMISKMVLLPGLRSDGTLDDSSTYILKNSYFEGSDDGATYTNIMTIKDRPPQVGEECRLSCVSFLSPP